MERTQEEIKAWAYEFNALFDYNNFVEAVKKGDNQLIEETKLIKIFDKTVLDGCEFIDVLKSNIILYRARVVKQIEDLPKIKSEDAYLNGFNEYGSKEPTGKFVTAGRCNKTGNSYLYLAENDYTACAEVRSEYSDLISLAKFKVNQDMRIINFCDDKRLVSLKEFAIENSVAIGRLITYVMTEFASAKNRGNGYEITQFIADYFQKAGFDGIAYRSSITGKKNYALFKTHKSYVSFLDSTLYFADRIKYNFYRLCDKTHITQNIDEIKYERLYNYIKQIKEHRKIEK